VGSVAQNSESVATIFIVFVDQVESCTHSGLVRQQRLPFNADMAERAQQRRLAIAPSLPR